MNTSLSSPTLKAGVAKVDITPPSGERLWGYADRTGAATGVLDPLWARALVLESEEKRLALVSVDLGRPFGPASLGRLRHRLGRSCGISCQVVAASHTHSAPVIKDEHPGDVPPPWEAAALEKVATAVEKAHEHAEAARIGAGYGTVRIGHNRRQVNTEGSVTWVARNPEMRPTSPEDSTVSVLRVDTQSARPLAILVNYACHPVIFGSDNREYSADFPGVAASSVERAFGEQLVCLFLQGAAGDINPFHAVTPLANGAVSWCSWTGERLGNEAARIATNILMRDDSTATLDVAEDLLTFRLRWDLESFRRGLRSYGENFLADFAPTIRQRWDLPVLTILLNKQIALMTVPGEAFVSFQSDWRRRCPAPNAFFVGYANGYFGYFPTLQAASEGGYGAVDATTWVEVGAGERIVDHALIRVHEMLGRLHKAPQYPQFR
jgi:neutral ceramidase